MLQWVSYLFLHQFKWLSDYLLSTYKFRFIYSLSIQYVCQSTVCCNNLILFWCQRISNMFLWIYLPFILSGEWAKLLMLRYVNAILILIVPQLNGCIRKRFLVKIKNKIGTVHLNSKRINCSKILMAYQFIIWENNNNVTVTIKPTSVYN